MFTGNEHRSWIDITITSRPRTVHKHQTINFPFDPEQQTVISTVPNITDQVLVFNLSNLSGRFGEKNVQLWMHGKSHKTFKMTKTIQDRKILFSVMKLKLKWLVTWQQSTSHGSLLSLQGASYQLRIDVYCEAIKTCPKLNVHWIPCQLSKYRDGSHNRPLKCLKLHQGTMTNTACCLKFSSISTKQHYYVYITSQPTWIQDMPVKPNKDQTIKKLSWNDASSLCHFMGGFLPIIRSKSELNEFIALIRFSQYIPPQQEVFIGLQTNINSKVIRTFSFKTCKFLYLIYYRH